MNTPMPDANRQHCPSEVELRGFLDGSLTDEIQFSQIASHVENCIACQRQMANASTCLESAEPGTADGYESEPECARTIAIVEALPRRQSGTSLPETIGHYRILDSLGQGGMGVTYKAWHEHLKRVVVLKLISHELAGNTVCQSQFAVEQEAIGRLNHPNVATAHDAGVHEGTPFLILEYVEGVSLQELLRQQEQFSISRACEICRDIAFGLQAIHEVGFVHCDIKPANVIVTPGGQVKILDFGLARNLSVVNRSIEKATGTRSYQSPEQSRCGSQIDFRSDLYSLGATLYCLLCGAPPSPMAAVNPTSEVSAGRRVRDVRPEIPAELSRLIERLLSVNPLDRPESARVVAATLDRYCPTRELSPVCPRLIPRQMLTWGLSLTCGIAGLVCVWVFALQRTSDTAKAVFAPSNTVPLTAGRAGSDSPHSPGVISKVPQIRTPWKPGSGIGLLPGLATEPALLPGVVRWQVETRQPRGPMRAIAWDPLEARLACASDDGQVRIYTRLNDGLHFSQILPCNGASTPQFRTLGWDSTGEYLLSGDSHSRCELDLWKVDGNDRLLDLKAHATGIACVSWAPDGLTFASAGLDGHVRVWNKSGILQGEFSAHNGAVNAVAWNPHKSVIASAGADGTIRLWDSKSMKELTVWSAHELAVRHLAWHPEGNRLVSCDEKSIIAWEIPSESAALPKATPLEPATPHVRFLAWRGDGKYLATGGLDVRVWNADLTTSYQVAAPNGEWLEAVSWGPRTGRLTFAPANGSIEEWDPEQKVATRLHDRPRLHFREVKWSPDGQALALHSDRGRLLVFDNRGQRLAEVGTPVAVSCTSRFEWHPHRNWVVTAIDQPTPLIQIWDLSAEHEIRKYSPTSAVVGLEYLRDADQLLTVHVDGSIQITNVSLNESAVTVYRHSVPLLTADLCAERGRLAIGDVMGDVIILDLTNSQAVRHVEQFNVAELPITALAWNHLGSTLAAGDSQSLCVRDVAKQTNLVHYKNWLSFGTLDWTKDDHRLLIGAVGALDAVQFRPQPPLNLWLRASVAGDGKLLADCHVMGFARVRSMTNYVNRWGVAFLGPEHAFQITRAGEVSAGKNETPELVYIVESPQHHFETMSSDAFLSKYSAAEITAP